jgi:pimeloyl-ACP methyl ester carboxylesterase
MSARIRFGNARREGRRTSRGDEVAEPFDGRPGGDRQPAGAGNPEACPDLRSTWCGKSGARPAFVGEVEGVVQEGPTFWEGAASVRQQLYDPGDKAGALDAFLTAVVGANYRQIIEQFLPPGALELAVTDLDTFFQVEIPALQQWRVAAEDATRIYQPILSVVGTETAPIFRESHALVKQWMPQTEELVVPQATHALQYMNPSAVADGLARFVASHKL